MGKKAKDHPTRAERLAALKREFNIPAGKVKNPLTPAQQKASLQEVDGGIGRDRRRIGGPWAGALSLEGVKSGAILPSWAEKLLKPATEPERQT